MNLAKDCVDVGLFTSKVDAQLAFWRDQVGLSYTQRLELGEGRVQHRFDIDGSVLKVNQGVEPTDTDDRSGYRRLFIVQHDRDRAQRLVDPDGNEVELIPPGHLGISQLGVELRTPDPAAASAFYQNLLGFRSAEEDRLTCGRSTLLISKDTAQPATEVLRARGFRYLTVQIHDLALEHARILEAGGREGMAPVRAGEIAKFSFVRDPDGNWIEISQRASLTGPLD